MLIELHPHLLPSHGHDGADVTRALLDAGYRGWTIRHATSDVRRAAYARNVRAEDFLAPFNPGEPLGSWPHQLWAAPGVAPFFGAGIRNGLVGIDVKIRNFVDRIPCGPQQGDELGVLPLAREVVAVGRDAPLGPEPLD